MKQIYFASVVICLFLLPQLKAEANSKISQRLSSSDVICEGVVTAVESSWNTGHTMINSVYHVTVNAKLIGSPGSSISFSCAGGQVGNDLIVSSSAPGIGIGNDAVFFFHSVNNNLELLPGEWGVIHLPGNGGAFADGSILYNSAGQLRQQLEQATGHTWDAPFSEAAARIITQTSSAVQLSSFSPASIPAGNNSVLTIRGIGFGTTQGMGKVLFTNADLAGLVRNVEPFPSQYISWTDTLIQVIVPSLGYVNSGTAGSGFIEVENNGGMSSVSSTNLIVPYSLINILASGAPARPDLVNDNLAGGYTIILSDTLVQNTIARQSFFNSLERWRCATLANFTPDYSLSTFFNVGADGVNIVRFDSMNTYILGVTYSFYTLCSGIWRLTEFDIDFNNQINWNFSSAPPSALQQDFQSCCMNLIGFALLLDNVMDTNDVMYSDPAAGTIRRNLNSNNIAGETDVLSFSALPNLCGPQPHQPVTNCAVGAPDDASIKQVTWPFNGFCQGNFPVKVTLVNYGSSTLSTIQINWKLDGVGQTPFSWSGTLLHSDSLTVNIGTANFIPGGHTIESWTSMPNGNADGFVDNDTANYAFLIGTCTSANSAANQLSSPSNYTCPGILPVTVTIYNFGPATLNYAEVHWKINGVLQPPAIWTGAVPAATTSTAFIVGTYNFTQPSNTIKVWTSNPNGIPDSNPSNDTLNATYAPVGLSGVYTVGGASPDYATVTAAITAINNFGMCGPVTFNLRPGIYTGGVTLNALPSAQRPLLIQSENGDSSTVIIGATNGNNFTINGGDYITFRKLTLQTTDGNTSTVVAFAGDANNNTVENCVIIMPPISSANQNVIGISTAGAPCDSIIIRNCTITRGSRGIQFSSLTSAAVFGSDISGCSITQQYDYCILVSNYNTVLISANILSATATNCTGLALTNCNGTYKVSGNKVTSAATALSMSYCSSSLSSKGLFINNFFTSAGGNRCIGLDNVSGVNFFNNSVRGPVVYLFYLYSNTNLDPHLGLVNNIFCNLLPVGSYIFNFGYYAQPLAVAFDTLMNNAYYQAGDAFGLFYNVGTGFDLAQWQGLTHADSGSVMVSPQFVSSTDLHIIPTFSSLPLKGTGISLSPVSLDIDNQLRNTASIDIGADEFGLFALDVATSNVQPGVRACSGVNPVTVRLSNFGSTPLTSAIINWKVNNVIQTPYSWSGTLSSMGSIDPVTIGSYNFPTAMSYTIQVWTTLPNSGTDAVPQNDTSTVIIIGGGMSGTYTIGGASPDYTTLAQASSALNARGVCGPVTFRIRAGTYASANFNATVGASLINTITFLSDNGDSSTVTTGFTFAGLGYYHVHQLIISALTFNAAKHIHISNCISPAVASTPNAVNENIELENCRFNSGITMVGYYYSNGLYPVHRKHINISIHNNEFVSGGVNLTNMVGAKVFNNRMLNNGIIKIHDVFDTLFVGSNFIGTTISDGMDIEMQSAAPGIHPTIRNNMISVQCTTAIYGMNIATENDLDILNNTIRYVGMPGSWAFRVVYPVSQNHLVRIINNNFSNFSGGYAMEIGNSGTFQSDYNNLYTNGNVLVIGFQFGIIPALQQWIGISGQDLHSVSAQPSFVSATDLHANNDHVLLDAGIPLAEVTTDIDNQLRNTTNPDIGADEFVFVPVAPTDAGISNTDIPFPLCQGNHPVKVNIRNYGSLPLTSATINWNINGLLQAPFIWNGNLTTLDTSSILTIGTFSFMAPDTYKIKVWTSQPNAGIDGFTTNDTCITNWVAPQLSGTYTVAGIAPDFPTVDDAIKVMNARGICGSVVFNIRSGYYFLSQGIIPVSGASAINTITFQSEVGDSTFVTLNGIDLNNSAHFHFHQLTFNNFITPGNGSNHIHFSNCVFNSYFNASSYRNEYFLMENNVFRGYVSFSGPSLTYERGNVFRGNKFVSCATLMANSQENVIIEGNSFDCSTTTSNNPAISVVICGDSSRATENYIYGNYYVGIHLNGSHGTNQPVLTSNNMISGGTNMIAGIRCAVNNEPNYIYNNSVWLQAGTCLTVDNSDVDLRNNILYNSGTNGYAYRRVSPGNITSTNNVLFSSGPGLAIWQTTVCTTLVQLQTLSGTEANSLNVNPVFVSVSDLHILNQALDGMGVFLPAVNVDFDLEPRQNPPDIGADERNFFPNDIGIVAFVQPIPACEGSAVVSVKLKNFGTQNLTSSVVQWTMDGILQTPVSWSGNLTTGGMTTVILGNYTFQHATTVQLKAWTEQPNGFVDLFTLNDTLASVSILPRISGTFTIGGVSPDYTDFTSAVSDLTLYGICGPVVFNVRNGTYNEQVTIGTITGTSVVNNITFQSETGDSTQVTLSYSSGMFNNYIVQLQNCSDITFRQMTLQALSPAYGRVIVANGNLNRISFRNNQVFGIAFNPSAFDLAVITYSGASPSEYFRVENNYITNGIWGLYAVGPGLTFTVPSMIVQNNIFENQYVGAISFGNQSYAMIIGNLINTNSVYTSYNAIISGNTRYSLISNNNITGFIGNGIGLSDTYAARIYNNFISVIQPWSGNYAYSALIMTSTTATSICNNSCIVTGDHWIGHVSAFFINTSDGSNSSDTIINNSFVSMGERSYAINWSSQNQATNFVMDHNNYFTCGNNLMWGLNFFSTLQQWQTYSGKDSNSVSVPPMHISVDDLHIVSNSFLDGKGIAMPYVNLDIDGQARNLSAPDIGADEFSSLANDAAAVTLDATNAICTGGNVSVIIGNFGTNALSTVDIHWSVNGIQQPVYYWTGNLPPATFSSSIVLGTYLLSSTDTFVSWTELPNGIPDSYPQTDSSCCNSVVTVTLPSLGPDVTVCSGTPVNLSAGNFSSYLWSDGSTSSSINVTTSGVYWITVTSPSGCSMSDTIIVTILPSPAVPTIVQNGSNLLSSSVTGNQWYLNGNPISGATNQLYIAVTPGTYMVTVTDPNGCSSSSVPVTIVGIRDYESKENLLFVYPNPSTGSFNVEMEIVDGDNVISLSLFDTQGRIVWASETKAQHGTKIIFNINENLNSGIYMLEVQTQNRKIIEKVVIKN